MSETLRFEKINRICIMAMKLSRSHPSIARDKIWTCQFIFLAIILLACKYLLVYSILFFDMKNGNFYEGTKNGAILLISFNADIKYIVLLYYQNEIMQLIRIIEEDYKIAEQSSEHDKAIVLKYAKTGAKACLFWFVAVIAASAVFPVKAWLQTAYSIYEGEYNFIQMFPLTLQEPLESYKNTSPGKYIFFGLCLFYAVYSASMYLSFDPIVPIFTLHISGQIELLSSKIKVALTDATSDKEREENLKKIIIKLQGIYDFVNRCKIYFSAIYEFNMKSTNLMTPLSTLYVVEGIRNGYFNIEFINLLIGSIVHFWMPCYYNDFMTEKHENFRQAIYCCGWEKYPDKSVRRTILFMLNRAARPLGISTIFYTVSLNTFAESCHQSYALFNLMNAAWVN